MTLHEWKTQLKLKQNIAGFDSACEFAEKNNVTTLPVAKNTIELGMTMVDILFPLNCDSQTLIAAMIYPAVFFKSIDQTTLQATYPNSIVDLVFGARRLEAIHNLARPSFQAQQKTLINLRKMLLAIVDDVRIVFIKLAERLAVLQYLHQSPSELRKPIAEETLLLYAPLANRLGIGTIKWKLEDYCFRYLNPEEYHAISKELNMHRNDREKFIQLMVHKLTSLLNQNQIKHFEIKGRAKHIYSIYRKMVRKKINIDQLYDVIAFRILVPTAHDCYAVLSFIHDQWRPIPSEFNDYISHPKSNGYRSIHTAVIGPHHVNIEIQIRSYQMHEEAELGVAAHWKYKEQFSQEEFSYEEKITLLREVLNWQKEISSEQKDLYQKIFEDRIYVFSPKGDIYDLPSRATPLDFAYLVHTQLGHRCRGAKINNQLVPLTYTLRTGDVVQIITGKTESPSRDWLNIQAGYLNSAQARQKVRNWFKKQDYTNLVNAGQNIWEKASRRTGIKKSELELAVSRFNYHSLQDLFLALGNNTLSIHTVMGYLQSLSTPSISSEQVREQEILALPEIPEKKSAKSNLIIEGEGDISGQIARCCHPIPGDLVLGYVTKNRGITIHQQNCHNIRQAIKYRGERVLQVHWSESDQRKYHVSLIITANDRQGLVRDISNIIAQSNVPIESLVTRVDKIRNEALIHMTIEVSRLEILKSLIQAIRQVPQVIEVKRKE